MGRCLTNVRIYSNDTDCKVLFQETEIYEFILVVSEIRVGQSPFLLSVFCSLLHVFSHFLDIILSVLRRFSTSAYFLSTYKMCLYTVDKCLEQDAMGKYHINYQ